MREIRKLGERMGAEITGIDLRQMDEDMFRWLHQAFLEHVVVVVRDQELAIQQFLDIGARFGPLRPHLVKKSRHPDYPDLMIMDNKVADTRTREVAAQTDVTLVKLATTWHTDMSYEIDRPMATQMYSLAVPSTGGDTPFVNMYTAYETLPAALKKKVETLSASYLYGGRKRRQQDRIDEEDRKRAPAVHPLVETHPETGRKTLYFNSGQVMNVIGVSPEESADIIAAIEAHTESENGDYRHKWRKHDLVIWDNRCSVHTATGDYPLHEHRSMWRTTINERRA
jgi:taurine dioxygenase